MIYRTHTGEQYRISWNGEHAHVAQIVDGREHPVSASMADTITSLVKEWTWRTKR